MAFARARTALASLEEKIRKQLGLAGEIGAQFHPDLSMVIVAGDLREPGNAFFKGRHFSVSPTAAGLPSAAWSFQPQADVLIDQFTVSATAAAATVDLYLGGGLGAGAALMGTWTERKVAGDQVPIQVSNLSPGAATDQNRVYRGIVPVGTTIIIPVSIMLVQGDTINVTSGANATFVSLRGRIWP